MSEFWRNHEIKGKGRKCCTVLLVWSWIFFFFCGGGGKPNVSCFWKHCGIRHNVKLNLRIVLFFVGTLPVVVWRHAGYRTVGPYTILRGFSTSRQCVQCVKKYEHTLNKLGIVLVVGNQCLYENLFFFNRWFSIKMERIFLLGWVFVRREIRHGWENLFLPWKCIIIWLDEWFYVWCGPNGKLRNQLWNHSLCFWCGDKSWCSTWNWRDCMRTNERRSVGVRITGTKLWRQVG